MKKTETTSAAHNESEILHTHCRYRRTNAFSSDDSDDVVLGEMVSRFNHSCNSNCEQHWDKALLRCITPW
jgi:hypothetical protein